MAQVLVVGPHPDDQEIGMGGTIARLAQQGHDVLLLDMTDGSPTPLGDRSTRLPEAMAALRCLQPGGGANAGGRVRRALLDLPNRRVEHTLEARHLVAGVIRAHQSQIVFMPHPLDAHPDHLAVTRIVEDARFDAKLTKVAMPHLPVQPPEYAGALGAGGGIGEGVDGSGRPIYPRWVFYYYCSHLRRPVDPHFLFDTSGCSELKIRAVQAYDTQFGTRPGTSANNTSLPQRLAHEDERMGWLIGSKTAEPFWTKEPVGLMSFDALPM